MACQPLSEPRPQPRTRAPGAVVSVLLALLALLAASLSVPPARAAAFVIVEGDLAGGSVAQAGCDGSRLPPGCPSDSVPGGGWWRVGGPTFEPAIGARAEWTPRPSPVGVQGRWRAAPRWVPDAPAASDLGRSAAHEAQIGVTARLDLPGTFVASLHPRGGWSFRQWHAWQTTARGWRAEHRIDAHGVTLGAALRVRLDDRFAVEVEGELAAVLGGARPGFGGGRVELAGVLRPRGRPRGIVRVAVFGDRRSLTVAAPAPHGIHAARLERLVVGLRVGLGFGTKAR